MAPALRFALLALLLLPVPGHAQGPAAGAVGLEMPAPAAPSPGHFLTGAYVSGSYTPVLAAGGVGYAVQPYLRYVLGGAGRSRPFVQYSFSPYWAQAYGSAAALAGPGADGQFPNPAFAPLPLRGPAGRGYGGYGNYGNYSTLSSFSVGVPVRVGGGALLVHVGGSLLGGLLR